MAAPIGRTSARSVLCALVLAALWLSAGCANPIDGLPSEMDSPTHRRFVELARDLPESTIRVPVTEPDGRVLHLALHESTPPVGAIASKRIIMIHGVLSDSRMWRYVRGDLGRDHLITTVDLLGCGQSDSPDPDDLPADAYDPSALARRVLQALRQRLAVDPPGTRLTLIGHSLGGTVILRMYAMDALRNEYRDVLERVDGAILFTPADAEISHSKAEMTDFSHASEWSMCLAGCMGVFERRVYDITLAGVTDPQLALREEAQRFAEVLRDPPRRRAGQAMIRQVVPMKEGQPDRVRIAEIVRGYAQMRIPVLLVWGEQDQTLPVSMGHKLAAQLPEADLRVVPHAMHSVPCEYPDTAIRLIREWTTSPGTP